MRKRWIFLLALTVALTEFGVTAGSAQSGEWQQLWNGKDF